MSLPSHFHERNWTALEDAWTELIVQAADQPDTRMEEVWQTLQMASERRQMSVCVPFVKEHSEILVAGDLAKEAARMLGIAMLGGGSPGELAKPLYESASAAWGAEDWWGSYVEIAGFTENAPDPRAAWEKLRKLLDLDVETAVYHAKGWGIGLVTAMHRADLECEVRFATGMRDRFPLTTAVDIFEVLGADDLRSLVIRDPDELKRRVKEEPLEVLRRVLVRYQGKATQPLLKTAMGQIGIDGPAFTAWWKKARTAAESSPWFELSGSGTRAVVRALVREADPKEGLVRQLRMLPNLKDVLTRVRAQTEGSSPLADEMRAAAIDTLEELAADESHPLPQRVSSWMFLREARGETPAPLAEMLAISAADPHPEVPSEPPPLWKRFQEVPGARDQERCIELLREVVGDDGWLDEAARELHHAAPGMVRGLVDLLLEAGRGEQLAAHYHFLLARQTLNPQLFVRLSELVEQGTLPGEFPPALLRIQALLQLSTRLLEDKTSSPPIARARTRLTALLCDGADPLLKRQLRDAGVDALRATYQMVERGVEDQIERKFTELVVEVAPEIFKTEEIPFWEQPVIWTTREGLARKEAELKELTEVKIPENSEAIGKAASLGDLSENSEWESAMEEQRTLTARAAQLEVDIKAAELLEDAFRPSDIVCPGTVVSYRETATDTKRTIRILGPWDTEDEGDEVVSYKSPLAAGLLGKTAGEKGTLQLPSGTLDVEVLHVDLLELA